MQVLSMVSSAVLVLLLILLLPFVIIVYYFSVYNRLKSLRNAGDASLSQARVAMKKRLDLIGQLVETVQSYARFERKMLENITSMRANIGGAGTDELSKIDKESRGILGNITAVAESYPELKTSESVAATIQAIRDVEDEIARHRYTFNNIIQEFNTILDTVPSKFVGRSVGMRKKLYLDFWEEELERPVVSWG